jgi:hypothetical protein
VNRCSSWTPLCAGAAAACWYAMAGPPRKSPALAGELGVAAVFANRDYEPQAKRRDAAVSAALNASGIAFESFKDQAVLDGDEVLTQAGRPFTVFTPYKKAWLKRLTEDDVQPGERRCRDLARPPKVQRLPGAGGTRLCRHRPARAGLRSGDVGRTAIAGRFSRANFPLPAAARFSGC